ncbi:hypothetical protein Trydic_g16281 [Trypoxylus dichotomus]
MVLLFTLEIASKSCAVEYGEFDVISPSDPTHFGSTGLFDLDVLASISRPLKDWTFPIRCYTVQELSSDYYPVITETYLVLPMPARGTVSKLHNWCLYQRLITETTEANARIEVPSTEGGIDDFVQKSQVENLHKILKKDRKLMPEIQHGQERCRMDQEKAEVLADTFATQFLPNCRSDLEQESMFQNTQEEIDEMGPGLPNDVSSRQLLEIAI